MIARKTYNTFARSLSIAAHNAALADKKIVKELFSKMVRIDMEFARLLPIIEEQDNATYDPETVDV